MASYSIKELEVLTGIKSHTIRIWEQRYNILNPNRTDSNIRYYTEEDLRYLLNIALLNKNGYKISKISKLTHEEVKQEVLNISETNFEFDTQLDSLILSMMQYDEESFEKIVSTNILRSGFENTFLKIIFPFLNKIGMLWQTEVIRPAQEHFISNLIRQKLIVALDSLLNIKHENSVKFMLYLPDKELHEITLLFMNYIIKSRGMHTLYLGASVPYADLLTTYQDYKPHYIFTIFTSQPTTNQIQNYVNILSQTFFDCKVVIAGRQVVNNKLQTSKNVSLLYSLEEAIEFIDDISETIPRIGNYQNKSMVNYQMRDSIKKIKREEKKR